MTERDFEDRLRADFSELVDQAATDGLRSRVIAIPDVSSSPERPLHAGWRFPAMNRFVPLAVAATVVVVMLLVGVGLFLRPPNVGPPSVPIGTPVPTAQAAGTWIATGTMLAERNDYTATLLTDGTVLVAGIGGNNLTASAELYDPASGKWTATENMLQARSGHTATLLPDGRVLVAGGGSPDSDYVEGMPINLASAELFDPASGTWTATGSMTQARAGHTATLLPDGTVLVAGGGNGPDSLATAELFDPATGTWTATGTMDVARTGHTATMLPDGTVLVAGGNTHSELGVLNAAEVYDPAAGTWTATRPMTAARAYHTATLLPDGTVLVAGGVAAADGPSPLLASAELYDPDSGRWKATGIMSEGRSDYTATLLSDGTVLVAGSAPPAMGADPLASAELYDPGVGTWTAAASMNVPRHFHAAVLLPDGLVLVAGGGVSADSAELYDRGSGH